MTLSVVVPVVAEGIDVATMVRMLRGVVDAEYEIVVVHSPERRRLVAPLEGLRDSFGPIRFVVRPASDTVTDAIRAGAEAASGDIVLVFAADEVGPLLLIDEMLSLMAQGCALVSCTRYAHGGRRLGGPLVARVLSRWANWTFHTCTGFPLTDSTTGIKMCRRRDLLAAELTARVGWACMFELALKLYAEGGHLAEVPVVSIDRLFGGTRTFQLVPWIVEYSRWYLWGVRMMWRRRRVAVTSGDSALGPSD